MLVNKGEDQKGKFAALCILFTGLLLLRLFIKFLQRLYHSEGQFLIHLMQAPIQDLNKTIIRTDFDEGDVLVQRAHDMGLNAGVSDLMQRFTIRGTSMSKSCATL